MLRHTRDPRLAGAHVERMPPGPGRRSHLFSASTGRRAYVVKVRRSPRDTAEREAWALRRLRGTIAPRLVAWWPTGPQVVPSPTRALGGGLVMTHVPGETPDPGQLELVARTVARLHSHAPRRGPELLCPSSVGALFRYAADLADRVGRRDRLPAPRRAALGRALGRLADRPAPELPIVRTLCHGDLRWHNLRSRGTTVKLLDFELAGIGDPAVDLALMVARTPLSEREARALLSSYLAHRPDETLEARYRSVLPLVSLVSALSAALAAARDAEEELDRALARCDPWL